MFALHNFIHAFVGIKLPGKVVCFMYILYICIRK